jgi:hypothetical protein
MVTIEVEEGQKNSQYTKIQKVLGTDNKMICSLVFGGHA